MAVNFGHARFVYNYFLAEQIQFYEENHGSETKKGLNYYDNANELAAMKQTPDYLVIGEVRDGIAAMSLFRALMTVHSGACTFHADSPREAARRLATVMGADAGGKPHEANQMISDAVDVLVQIGIWHEVRRETAISNVAKDLKNGNFVFERFLSICINRLKKTLDGKR